MGIQSRRRLLQFPLLLTALAAVQLTSPDSCLGQEATLAPGDRIRVKPLVRPKDRVIGSFVAVAADSLSFDFRGDVRRLALSDIKTLQVSAGQGSHIQGTILGGLAGAVGGAFIGAAAADNESKAEGGFVGLLIGSAVGAVLGWALLTPEKWVTVPIADLRLTRGPGSLQFQFGL